MLESFNKYFLSAILIGFIFIFMPITSYADVIKNSNEVFVFAIQKTINNYEKSQPSTIDNPVIDPNFNVMRSKDSESAKAIYIVIGLLIAATIIPLATWWYFSKN